MPVRGTWLIVALTCSCPAFAQNSQPIVPRSYQVEPELQLGSRNFALPIVEYRAPDGTWKRSSGIIFGHDVSPNTTVGIGVFRMKPKHPDATVETPGAGKSKKVSLGLSLRF